VFVIVVVVVDVGHVVAGIVNWPFVRSLLVGWSSCITGQVE